MDELTRAVMHRTSHKINTNELSEKQCLKRARKTEKKIENYKKRRIENMDKLPTKTTQGEDIPETARPEILMGRIEISYLDDNMVWKCKKCEYINNSYKSMSCHLAARHKIKSIHVDNRIKCPFGRNIYQTYAGMKAHLFYKNGCNNYIDIQNSANPINGPEIWRRIINCNEQM